MPGCNNSPVKMIRNINGDTNMKKVVIIILMPAIVLLSLVTSFSKEPIRTYKKIIIALDATWPPMEYVDQNHKITGFSIDLMNAAAEEGGFTVEFRNTAWDGIFSGLTKNKYDAVCSSVTITEERKKWMDFSITYLTTGQVLVVKKELNGLNELSMFAGKTVAAQLGTIGVLEIKKYSNIIFRDYYEPELAMEDLLNNKIDAFVCENSLAVFYVYHNPQYRYRLKIVGKPLTEENYGVAVKKGNIKIVELLNNGLKKVKAKGIDKELENKWLKVPEE